jgi:hypothetical protein
VEYWYTRKIQFQNIFDILVIRDLLLLLVDYYISPLSLVIFSQIFCEIIGFCQRGIIHWGKKTTTKNWHFSYQCVNQQGQTPSLNQHLHRKNIVDSPNCICGSTESTTHYLFNCLRYTAQRQMYINTHKPDNRNTSF